MVSDSSGNDHVIHITKMSAHQTENWVCGEDRGGILGELCTVVKAEAPGKTVQPHTPGDCPVDNRPGLVGLLEDTMENAWKSLTPP